jgi:hypothetical protein
MNVPRRMKGFEVSAASGRRLGREEEDRKLCCELGAVLGNFFLPYLSAPADCESSEAKPRDSLDE